MRYKKILSGFFTMAAALTAALIVTGLYLYHHPATLKAVVEWTFSSKDGRSLKIEDLVYSVRPLHIQATHIVFDNGNGRHGFTIRAPKLTADFDLSGPFGSRTLIVKRMALADAAIDLRSWQILKRVFGQPQPPSLLAGIRHRLIKFFLFADVRIRSAAATGGRIDLQSDAQQLLVRNIQARFQPDNPEISGYADIHWQTSDLRIRFPEVRLVMDPGFYTGESIISGRMHLPGGTVERPSMRAAGIQGQIQWSFNPELKRLTTDSVNLACNRLTLVQKTGETTALNELHFTAGGELDLQQNRLNFPRWRLTAKNLVDLDGKAEGGLQTPYGLKIGLTGGRLIAGRLNDLIQDWMGLSASPLALSGPVGLNGTVEIQKTAPGWSIQGDLTAGLNQNRFSLSGERIRLDGSLSGQIRAAGNLAEPDLSATISGENLAVTGNGITLKPINAKLSASAAYPAYSVSDLKAHIARAVFAVGTRDYHLDDIRLHLKNGGGNLKSGNISWPQIRLSSSVLQNLNISVSGRGEQMLVNLAADDSRILQAASALGLLPADWKINGQDALQATAVIRQQGWSTVSSKMNISGLNFHNPDESCLAENMRVAAETSALVDMKAGKFEGTFSLKAPTGEFLCDKIYLDMRQNTFAATGNTAYDRQSRIVRITGVKLGLQNLMALDVHGSLQTGTDRPGLDLFVELPATDFKPVFRQFVAEPYKFEKPGLADLAVDGFISARLNLSNQKSGWSLRGKTSWQTGRLKIGPSRVLIDGIDLDLPLWFQTQPDAGSEIQRGRLSIQKLNLPLLPAQPLAVSLKVRPDSIATAAPIRLLFESGDIVLEPLVFKNIYTARPTLNTGLKVNSILLDPIINGIWPKSTGGVIHGKLERIHYDGDSFRSQGTLTTDVFGGRIHISDPGASALLAGPAAFRLDARIDDLKLAPLTEGTTFGKIQGILDGYINNLEIANGEPQKFQLLLKTRRRNDIPQKINVRAVENIARLGGGQSPFMGLAGTVVSMFKEFSYKNIGVAASLENDMFTVNGTIKENGQEYIVKKGGLTGVDVINLNPDNRISFKDMVSRVKRIKSSGQDPVIR